MSIPIFRPCFKRRDLNSILSCIVSDKIGPGSFSKEITKTLAKLINVKGGVAVNNYYAAIETALEVLGLQSGDSLVLSPLAPLVYLQVLTDRNITPLFADVDSESALISPAAVEKLLGQKPKAILIHYTMGLSPDLEQFRNFGVPIIEDISQAYGGRLGEDFFGGLGMVSIYFADQNSLLGTDSAGFVFVNERHLLKEMKELGIVEYEPLTDLSASLLISQVHQLEKFIFRRRVLYDNYLKAVMRSRHKTLKQPLEAELVPYSFPLLVETSMNEVRQYALKKKIETAPAFFNTIIDHLEMDCPQARNFAMRCVLFPLYPLLSQKEVETILKVLATLP